MRRWSRRRVLAGGLALAGLCSGVARGVRPPWQPPRVARISYFTTGGVSEGSAAAWSAFVDELRALGYVDGQNALIEERHGDGAIDRLGGAAAELTRLQPDVILVTSRATAQVLRDATSTIPIVSFGDGDLVGGGLAASHARPGGNVTGLSTPPLAGKQLELLQEAVPALARVTVLYDATLPTFQPGIYEETARRLGLEVQFAGARRAEELEPGLAAAAGKGSNAVLAANGPLITRNQTLIGELALKYRLATIFQQSEAVGRGGLLTYSPNRVVMFRRAATYVDKILRGAKPAELPVEEPTRFDFIVNLKTAEALGLTIPELVLQQATEVIQ